MVQLENEFFMTADEFSKLSLEKRLELLKNNGDYVAGRELPLHFAYLFTLDGFFVEVYRTKALNKVQWIEIQTNQDILKEYVEELKLEL
jgi:hypothetical protein